MAGHVIGMMEYLLKSTHCKALFHRNLTKETKGTVPFMCTLLPGRSYSSLLESLLGCAGRIHHKHLAGQRGAEMEEKKWWTNDTVAVVTGANRGIGLEIVRLFAEKGITVVLTARRLQQGLSAPAQALLEQWKKNVIFHRLDVQSSESVSTFAEWLKKEFGGLDILALLEKRQMDFRKILGEEFWTEGLTENHETAKECIDVNYFGTKRVTKALIPLLRPSAAGPRIVNVSSFFGMLMLLRSEELQKQLSDIDKISEELIDSIVNKFLEDIKTGFNPKESIWPAKFPTYSVSKLGLNAYTRLLARDLYGKVCVNSVHPGFVKTDMTFNTGDISCVEGAENVVRVALLPPGGVSGQNFMEKQISSF